MEKIDSEIIQNKQKNSISQYSSWDSSKDFLENYFPLMRKIQDGDHICYGKVRELRKKEYYNTIKLVNNGFYITENGNKVKIEGNERMVSGTKFYSKELDIRNISKNINKTTIEVVNSDCLDEGIRLSYLGYNPAVLNMANRQNPGGGVANGASAQEEAIFRRTNIFRSLYQFAPYAELYGVQKSVLQYPMDRNFGGIYSPSVTLFREKEKNGYKLMEQPIQLAFISVAGINRPQLNANGMIEDFLIEPVKNKIRTIFRIGLLHGHDSLVLGALGCGAFRNPPRHIAKLFKEVLNETEFSDKYKHIVFAILEDHNSHKNHNITGNFLPFSLEFS